LPQVHTVEGEAVPVGTVFCIARNSFAHALELGNPPPTEPLVFLKSAHSVRPLDAGAVAFPDEVFHHEAELVLLIGEACALGADPGWSAVRGLSLGIDLTRRGVQDHLKRQGLPWTTAKSFQGSALVGPFLALGAFPDPDRLRFSLRVEGALRQEGRLDQMSFGVPHLLRWLLGFTPLGPGDLVYTGTPAGVGELRVGQSFALRFDDLDLDLPGCL
jgi:2-keto-4-pentenoate hydratase/2-oxohepta-3-ene-1,7-dioic acid hydratase in catechol pathway